MDEHRLEELKKLSIPALRHVELIEFARTQSPNQAQKLARGAEWPNRQAKATKSLALLRETFGAEVFETFITTMEHARSERSVTEQTQEIKRMSDRIKRSLELVSDPWDKLKIFLNNGLVAEATAFLSEFLNSVVPFFYFRGKHEPYRNDLFKNKPDRESPLCGVKIGFKPAGIDPAQYQVLSMHADDRSIDLPGLISALKWSEEQTLAFVRQLLERMLSYSVETPRANIHGMKVVTRHFLQSSDELARRVEQWMIRCLFWDDEFHDAGQLLPTPITDRSYNSVDAWCYGLNPIVDRLLELGMSESEIRDEFLAWLRKEAPHYRSRSARSLLAVAGAQCFHRGDKELAQALHDWHLKGMWKRLLEARFVDSFAAFRFLGLWENHHGNGDHFTDDEKFFTGELVKLLAEGKAGQVFQLMIHLGDALGIYPDEIKKFGGMPSRKLYAEKERAEAMMPVLGRKAFPLAADAERYGVAAALAQHFDCLDLERLGHEADLWLLSEGNNRERVTALALQYYGEARDRDLAEIIADGLNERWLDEEDEESEDLDDDESVDDGNTEEDESHQALAQLRAENEWLTGLRTKRNAKFEELKLKHREREHEVHDLALALEQPVCLEWMVYITSEPGC